MTPADELRELDAAYRRARRELLVAVIVGVALGLAGLWRLWSML